MVDGKRDAAAMLAGATGGPPMSVGPQGVQDAEADDAEGDRSTCPTRRSSRGTGSSVNGSGSIDDPDAEKVEA